MSFWPWKKKPNTPIATAVTEYRVTPEHAAIVFVPGFTGSVSASWQPLIQHVLDVNALRSWSVLGLDYASSRRFDFFGWQRDPSITIVAKYLHTQLSLEPFSRYRTVAFVTHSMGGLVVQKALVDDPHLIRRVSHLLLFGVPSGGVSAAAMASKLKRQIEDMVVGGKFIAELRAAWSGKFDARMPFELAAIAGDTDDFVGPVSSLEPFPKASQHVVPGNHSTLIKSDGVDHPSVQLISTILRGANVPSYIESARLAVERREFQQAIDRLTPHYSELDDAALVILAMALDGVGQGDEALRIIDDVYQQGRKTTAEAAGILAGRIKRRWLLERRQTDLIRATELYTFGLDAAKIDDDHDQMYYHAINLAFLQMMRADATADFAAVTYTMCHIALEHCGKAQINHWSLATEGEAHLMQGDLVAAEVKYRQAVDLADSVRALRSMGDQAALIAFRVGGDELVKTVQTWFQPTTPQR